MSRGANEINYADLYSDMTPPAIFNEIRKGRSVYIMTLERGSGVKIGISSDPQKRRASLQTGQDQKVILYWNIELTKDDAKRLERECHNRLKRTRFYVRGEWYRIEPFWARNFIKQTVNELGLSWMRGFSDLAFDDAEFSGMKNEVSRIAPDHKFYRTHHDG